MIYYIPIALKISAASMEEACKEASSIREYLGYNEIVKTHDLVPLVEIDGAGHAYIPNLPEPESE